jgi:2-succinyl-6-hydroxy-2,4-cyclohexadiene-1-carboxylate synthase
MRELIFVHGWLGAPCDWSPVVEGLPDRQVRCLRIPQASSWEEGVRRLTGELSEECILVGYSLGARLALGCVLTEPNCVSGLVMISGNAGLPAEQRTARWEHDCQLSARLLSQSPQQFMDDWYGQPVFGGLTAEWRKRLALEKSQVDRNYQAALLRAYSIGLQPDYWAQLRTLHVPVLIAVGQRDAKYVALGRRMTAMLPNARLHVIAQSGHVVHREQPRRLVTAIRGSLDWLAPRASQKTPLPAGERLGEGPKPREM